MNTFLIIAYYWVITFSVVSVISDPQINLLNTECSQYNVSNPSVFLQNVNTTFANLRSQLSYGGSTRSATMAQLSIGPDQVSAMVQCRNYLSRSDCLACFSAAEAQIRKCSIANGARVIYDGCLLRYESVVFLRTPGDAGICDNRTISQPTTFPATVMSLLSDIVTATPKINGFFATSIREVDSGGIIVYVVAQCLTTISQTDCGECLTVTYNNIERCPPAAGGKALGASCYLRYSDTAFFDGNQTTDLTSFLRQQGEGSNKNKVIIGAVVGGVALLLLVVAFIIWFRFCRRNPKREHIGDIVGATELRGPVNHSYKDLVSATKNFSEENKLGEGGFGDVYKGTLKNGKIVAVKRLAIRHSARAEEDFETEVRLISNVHHRNLIRLLGCCSKRQELLLVYEYMANSSLDKFLFGDRHGTLNWKQRFDIIVGTARGLAYLHEEFHVCIIHRDIKSSNILLDDNFQPRIADFGVARLVPKDQSHINTRFAGTLGYTAPEYAIHGQLSSKVDTYSFGVVVLEIISGRKSNDMKRDPTTQYLLEWAWKLYEDEMLMDLVDESLNSREYNTQEVQKVVEIALLCTQSSVASRPKMSEVVVLLLSKGNTEYTPTRPTFVN